MTCSGDVARCTFLSKNVPTGEEVGVEQRVAHITFSQEIGIQVLFVTKRHKLFTYPNLVRFCD